MKQKKNYKEPRDVWDERLWNEKFEQLKKHKELFDSLKIRKVYDPPYEHFKLLGSWCYKQRVKYKNNTLYSHRFILLSDLGFSFDPFGELWEKGYKLLHDHYIEYGTCKLPKLHKDFSIYKSWALNQRLNKNKLSKYQIDKLNKIGFEWRSWEEIWDDYYEKLKVFKSKNGTCNINIKDYIDKENLSEMRILNNWSKQQRTLFNEKNLSENRINKLIDIDFVFDYHQSNWERKFNELVKFKKEHGHCIVPYNFEENKSLGIWVFKQRRKRYIMSETKIKKLNRIGFAWNTYEENWEQHFDKLIEFKKKHGHCMVIKSMDPNLASWVHNQREVKRMNFDNRLSKEQIQMLDDLGFIWDPLEYAWQYNYDKLVKFKMEFGHTKVPHRKAKYKKLMNWAKHQREIKDKLPPDKIKKLDDLGFFWEPIEDTWQYNYENLVQFKNEFGHTRIPYTIPKFKQLLNWAKHQREIKDKLPPDKIKKLADLGFLWYPSEESWQYNYENLVQFKNEFGHINIPYVIPKYKKLLRWSKHLRNIKDKLSPDKIKKLDDLGFRWNNSE